MRSFHLRGDFIGLFGFKWRDHFEETSCSASLIFLWLFQSVLFMKELDILTIARHDAYPSIEIFTSLLCAELHIIDLVNFLIKGILYSTLFHF